MRVSRLLGSDLGTPAPRLTRAWIKFRACALLMAAACARESPPLSRGATPEPLHGINTPLGAGFAPPEAGRPLLEPQGVHWNLEDFRPLLTDPALAEAARAVEDEAPALALSVIDNWLRRSTPPGNTRQHWAFLRGRLLEQTGDIARAIEAFDAASSPSWALSGYAVYHAARLTIRAGQHAAGLERLSTLPVLPVLAEKARLLGAEAFYARGDYRRAISEWKQALEPGALDSAKLPEDWQLLALKLGDATLAELAPNSATTPAKAPAPPALPDEGALVFALDWAERVALTSRSNPSLFPRAAALALRLRGLLPAEARQKHAAPAAAAELFSLAELVRARDFESADELGRSLRGRLSERERSSGLGCEAGLLLGKAWAGLRRFGQAADLLGALGKTCREDPEQRARILFLSGSYSVSDKRYAEAISRFETIEKDFPAHRLADDARLRAARAYKELGSDARFGDLLSSMPDVYPEGDTVLDGVFELAVQRIEKGDWGGALNVLEKAARWVEGKDHVRGTEFSGRERYFLARARILTGEADRGLAEFERIIRELPLSYYMLQAFTRLAAVDRARAERALSETSERAKVESFAFVRRPELDLLGFQRVIELLRVGDIPWAKRELDVLGYTSRSSAPELLWAIALLYGKAGSAELSHGVARGLLTDWLSRWPAGDWESAWQIAFPRPYEKLVQRFAKQNSVDASLAYAVMREESGFDPRAASPANAYGLMQLIEPTARSVAKPLGLPHSPQALKNPKVNIALGCRVLGELMETFTKNPELVIPSYNAGPGRPRRWLRERPNVDFDVWVELIPFLETRRYTKRVLASRAAYRVLYEPAASATAVALPLKLEP